MAEVGFQRSGIPDLLICLKGKFIGIELKNEKGKPSPLQLHNIEQIKKSGGKAYILKPENFEEWKEKMNVQLQ